MKILFINSQLNHGSIDLYVIRKGIKDALDDIMPTFSGELLDVGAGAQPYRELVESQSSISKYTPLGVENSTIYPACEFHWDWVQMPIEESRFDTAMATEVLEHCPDPRTTLKEVHRVLKEGEGFFLTVPFIWPLHDCPCDGFRYPPFSLDGWLVKKDRPVSKFHHGFYLMPGIAGTAVAVKKGA